MKTLRVSEFSNFFLQMNEMWFQLARWSTCSFLAHCNLFWQTNVKIQESKRNAANNNEPNFFPLFDSISVSINNQTISRWVSSSFEGKIVSELLVSFTNYLLSFVFCLCSSFSMTISMSRLRTSDLEYSISHLALFWIFLFGLINIFFVVRVYVDCMSHGM